MNNLFTYFLIALGSTTLGAMTGMGGGVIMKPLLDAWGNMNAAHIGVLSSVTVLFMALVSMGKHIRHGSPPDRKTALPLAAGSLPGGYIGDRLLQSTVRMFPGNHSVVVIQNVCLALVLLLVLLYTGTKKPRPTLGLAGVVPACLTGTLLGIVSSFLGIGGGPINVALLIFVFSCDMRTATSYSIFIILFAQVSKLISVFLSNVVLIHELSMLPVMVLGAVLGGWIGSTLNQKLPIKTLEKAFACVQLFVLFICLNNILRNLVPC